MDLEISLYLMMTTKNIYLMLYVDNLFNFDTREFLIIGHMTCPENLKQANYSSL